MAWMVVRMSAAEELAEGETLRNEFKSLFMSANAPRGWRFLRGLSQTARRSTISPQALGSSALLSSRHSPDNVPLSHGRMGTAFVGGHQKDVHLI